MSTPENGREESVPRPAPAWLILVAMSIMAVTTILLVVFAM